MKKVFQPTKCLSRQELEHYSKGNVSDEQRHKIENHLLDCPLCAEALEGYQMLLGETDTDVIFDDLYQEIDAKTATRTEAVRRRIPWNSIAAGILFLLTASAAYLYYQSDQSTSRYQAYFEKQDQSFAMRSIDGQNLSPDLNAGLELYRNKNFQGSLSFFEDYLKNNPESLNATYYAGMSALNAGEDEIAFELLSTVRMNSDDLYEEATWRLSGIHLERGEVEQAKNLLKDLIKIEGGYFESQARALLQELE